MESSGRSSPLSGLWNENHYRQYCCWLFVLLVLVFSLPGCVAGDRAPSVISTASEEPATALPVLPGGAEGGGSASTPEISPSALPLEQVAPRPQDAELRREGVYLDSVQWLVQEGQPPWTGLILRGHLPTPCHALRVAVDAPDVDGSIRVDVYSVVKEEQICAQVLAPFEAQIPFTGYEPGHYTVLVNGEKVGEFDV